MKVLDMLTTAGGVGANEDRVGCRGPLAWVIDGATDLYEEAALPADSDVLWLVDTLARHLDSAGTRGYRGSATELLTEISEIVAREQSALGFPVDRVPPACSVALLVDRGSRYDVTRIGDATAVIVGRVPGLLATGYFDRREAAAVGTGEVDQRRIRSAMQERRLHTMTSGDVESVFSGHQKRKLRPHCLVGDWSDVDDILLCTDGFARLVTDYGIYQSWSDVVSDGRAHGLSYLEKLIRGVEAGAEGHSGRFKRSDDVAALLLTPA
ncbi:protein phosphatase 2C domain-containing protein [Micromonospora zhanjiangensis]|uniref:Protein phosphatase 2C domain-containing protein n=1 Tax=Micromonospora zhanjiangensis TaxID=1522057 RepID=A0ABV8KRV4_9ACTN